MEEGEYKSTYNKLAAVRCVFEKALTGNHAKCALAQHFWLADREGYSCKSAEESSKCGEILENLRKNSAFVLKLHDVSGPLPHNMEIRVQAGGVKGLALLVEEKTAADGQLAAADINGIVSKAVEKFGSAESLPFSEIMQSVMQFKGRRRRQR